ncbi:MAG: peptidase dimerization domain-containing protein [Acidobacteriota bacterium]
MRGLIYTEIEARGAMRDLHSGVYGGAAPNPLFALAELLTKLKDASGHIQVPGMYDDVTPPTADEKDSWDSLPFDEDEYRKKEVGSTELTG